MHRAPVTRPGPPPRTIPGVCLTDSGFIDLPSAARSSVRGMSSSDVVTLDDGTLVEYGPRMRPLLHLAAPLVAAAAVWAARQGINRTYTRVTGRIPPTPSDPLTSWRRAIAWTAATATTAAVIEVSVHRLADERAVRVLRRGRDSLARRRG